MRITFYGAAQTVTGSCHVVEAANKKIMIDCGMFQGHRLSRERNYLPFSMIPQTVDYLLITHAHIDHSGLVPKLYKHGFRAGHWPPGLPWICWKCCCPTAAIFKKWK